MPSTPPPNAIIALYPAVCMQSPGEEQLSAQTRTGTTAENDKTARTLIVKRRLSTWPPFRDAYTENCPPQGMPRQPGQQESWIIQAHMEQMRVGCQHQALQAESP